MLETKVLIEQWRKEYNQFRPHISFNYQPPAPETIKPKVKTLNYKVAQLIYTGKQNQWHHKLQTNARHF